eukprot:IDg3369t1
MSRNDLDQATQPRSAVGAIGHSELTPTPSMSQNQTPPLLTDSDANEDCTDVIEVLSACKRCGSGNPGRDAAKISRREDMAARAVVDLAKSMKEKNEVMEERNGILAFTIDTEELDEEEKASKVEYFKQLRAVHLQKMKLRAKLLDESVNGDAALLNKWRLPRSSVVLFFPSRVLGRREQSPQRREAKKTG